MQTAPSFELFDKFGHFVMPTDDQIATLEPDTQDRFAAVRESAPLVEKATELRKAADQRVADAIAERDASEKELRRLRPKIDPTANAKEWIRSQRAE